MFIYRKTKWGYTIIESHKRKFVNFRHWIQAPAYDILHGFFSNKESNLSDYIVIQFRFNILEKGPFFKSN